MECGECTLCCTMFPVEWLKKPMNTDCQHSCKGCMIHDTKPKECSDYNCMYAQMDKAPVALRPNNCGIIFDKISDEIIYGTIDPKNKPSEIAKKQIVAFMDQGFSVVVADINKADNGFYINPLHKEEHIRRDFWKQVTDGHIRN